MCLISSDFSQIYRVQLSFILSISIFLLLFLPQNYDIYWKESIKCITNKYVIKIYKYKLYQLAEMSYYQKDQLSIKTRSMLADYFLDLILITQSVQTFRSALATTQFFDGVQLFRFLDKDQKGYLTPKDFAVIISDKVKKILHYAFGWFDLSKTGEITRTQFLQFIFPRQNIQLRNLVSLRMTQQRLPQQKQTTILLQVDLLRGLILQIMQRQTKLIPIRRVLMDQDDFSIKGVMNALDVENRGWITVSDLHKFVENYGVNLSEDYVCKLINVYDYDINGKISLEELEWLIEGLERSNGSYRKIVRNSDRIASKKRLNSCCTCKKIGRNQSNTKIHQSHKKGTKSSNKKKQNQGTKKQKKKEKQIEAANLQSLPQTSKKQLRNRNQYQKQNNSKVFERISNTKKNSSKQEKTKQQNEYFQLKKIIGQLQKQTESIDNELIKHEKEMGVRTQLQMQKCLQVALIKKKLKQEQQQKLKKRIDELEANRRQDQKKKIKQIQSEKRKQLQQNILLEIQLQKNRIQLQKNRIRQEELERMREVQQRRTKQYQLEKLRLEQLQRLQKKQFQMRRSLQIQQKKLESIRILRETEIMENQRIRQKLQKQIYQRELRIITNERAIKLINYDYDWKSQARIKALIDQQAKQQSMDNEKYLKQNQYFQRYSSYCHHLAEVVDPLGINHHLAQTDKFLVRSKQLRGQINKDRTNSLNRYYKMNKSNLCCRSRNTMMGEDNQRNTPKQYKNENYSNKKTAQTKLGLSNT